MGKFDGITFRQPAGLVENAPLTSEGREFAQFLIKQRTNWYDVGRIADGKHNGTVYFRPSNRLALEAEFGKADMPVHVRQVKGTDYLAVTPTPVYVAQKAIREAIRNRKSSGNTGAPATV